MTYEQIEKEFDEKFCSFNLSADERCKECLHKTFDGSSVADGCVSADEYIKSFLKQSFIKYLEGEVDRLEESKRVIIICSDTSIEKDIACRSCSEGYSSCDNAQTDFVYNQAISDQITHLQAQIKELQ